MDLEYPFVLKEKLRNINQYYFQKIMSENLSELYADELAALGEAG
jgi:hypothetical protein